MGILYLVPTPLGNLEDITLRALRTLKEATLIATEDTRTTGKLLKHFEITRPLISYHEHSKPDRLERVLSAVEQGDVALVSEAGTPLLSDPGYKLVRTAIERGIRVIALPGPSAITAALAVSGLPTDRFLFMGFLPRKRGERRHRLSDVSSVETTLLFFESPHRLSETLKDMIDVLGAERLISICRELSKWHEEVWRGTLAEAEIEWSQREARGEFTLVVAGALPPESWDVSRVKRNLTKAIAAGMTAKDAVRKVTDESGWSKRDVYALVHELDDSAG